MTWEAMLEAYLEHLATTRRSKVTMESSTRWVQRLSDFCAESGVDDPRGVDVAHVAAFEHELLWTPGPHGQLYSPHTVQHVLTMLRLFFRWALRQEHLLLDPAREIVLRRATTRERHVPTAEEVAKLLADPDPFTVTGLRDRALLELLYSTGLRRGECHLLDIDDLDLRTRTLAVRHGKNGTARLQPVGDNLARALERYLSDARPQLVRRRKQRALFVGRGGGRIHYAQINNVVRQHAQAAGLARVTTHLLRHAFATHMLQGGAKVEDVSALLGHKTLGSTSIYTRVDAAELAKEHGRTHPRRKRRRKPKG